MGFEPNKITREHIFKAIKRIKDQKIELIASTKYDVIIDGNTYPPKDLLRFAHEEMNGENSWENSGGEPTNKYLVNLGFEVKPKNDPILDLIQKYKSYISNTKMRDEVYKWELVKKFKGRPDTNAVDFALEMKSIKFQNLLYAMSIAVTNHIAKDAPEEYRKLFSSLFDEDRPLNDRINSFNVESLKLYRSIGGELGHHQDERSIATYLTLHNPEKYTFYKSTFYKEFCKLMGVSPAGKNEKYGHYLELINQFIENYIVPDTELTNTVKSYIPEYYDGKNNMLLAQDILYCMLNKKVENNITVMENLKDAFAKWLTTNPKADYFDNDKSKLVKELTTYEDYFDFPLYETSDKEYNNLIEGINEVIYATSNDFVVFSEKTSSHRPRAILGKRNYQRFLEELYRPKVPKNDIMNYPLNQILYGPPGTGKTFHTINYALSIIEEKSIDEILKENRNALLSRYKNYVDSNVLAMVTFHQSYGYEDFIEGIKPIMEGESLNDGVSESITYQIVDGVFKQICSDARTFNENEILSDKNYFINPKILENKQFHKISLGNTLEESGNTIYEYCKQNNCVAIGWGEDVNYSGITSRKEIQERYTNAGFQTMQRDFNIDAIERLAIWIKEGDMIFVSHGNHFLKAIGIVEGKYEYKSSAELPFQGYNHFRKVKWLILDAMIPVKQVYYANFSQQSIYTLWNDKIKKDFFAKAYNSTNRKNRVLIIDEINRGNISSIFGELITLIEEDKRDGMANALSTILPYSKKQFSVPPNVHIIGTMNTADRSVEALDTALRRRFSFVEMLPKPELLKDKGENNGGEIGGIDLFSLLTIINERIEVLVDRDHTIGHAFFINDITIQELRNTFSNKIIPLLQEYFYGDYSKMELVIGSSFFDKIEVSKVKFAVKSEDFEAEGQVYHIKNISDTSVMSDKDFITALEILIKGEA